MLTWKETGSDGSEVVMRSGRGTVRALDALGARKNPEDRFSYEQFRIQIAVDPERATGRALRVTIAPLIDGGSPLMGSVLEALRTDSPVAFTIEFARKDHVPAGIPVDMLDMSRDMSARLTNIELIPELVHEGHGLRTETTFRGN